MLRKELVLIQHTPTPLPLFTPLPPPPFLLIIILVLNFQKHTRRENATVLPEQLRLCFQTAYYHQSGWIFSPSTIFFFYSCSSSAPPPPQPPTITTTYLMDFRQLQSAQKWRRRTHDETQRLWRSLTRCGSPQLCFSLLFVRAYAIASVHMRMCRNIPDTRHKVG